MRSCLESGAFELTPDGVKKTAEVDKDASVLRYAETIQNKKHIANELGVATIMERGAQRSGDLMRLNVQLIDVAKPHLTVDSANGRWSDQFTWTSKKSRMVRFFASSN